MNVQRNTSLLNRMPSAPQVTVESKSVTVIETKDRGEPRTMGPNSFQNLRRSLSPPPYLSSRTFAYRSPSSPSSLPSSSPSPSISDKYDKRVLNAHPSVSEVKQTPFGAFRHSFQSGTKPSSNFSSSRSDSGVSSAGGRRVSFGKTTQFGNDPTRPYSPISPTSTSHFGWKGTVQNFHLRNGAITPSSPAPSWSSTSSSSVFASPRSPTPKGPNILNGPLVDEKRAFFARPTQSNNSNKDVSGKMNNVQDSAVGNGTISERTVQQYKAPSGGLRPSDWSEADGDVNGGRRVRPAKRDEGRRHTVTGTGPPVPGPGPGPGPSSGSQIHHQSQVPSSSVSAHHLASSSRGPSQTILVSRPAHELHTQTLGRPSNYHLPLHRSLHGSESADEASMEGRQLSIVASNKNSPDNPKKGAILGHLQKKFPDYAQTISGRKDQVVMHGTRDGREWTKVVYSHLYAQRSHAAYQPPSSIYDDDPGIMSEAETSATGFRRGGKQRSSLPVVRTPNKSLERPLGLVFLQYHTETKRALLPNEITTMDTVKALFVRSFPKQLTMEYLESPHLRVYIHDPSKDMFYELEDLRDIRDRSVLRIYEQDVNGGAHPAFDQDMSYFSEPEFDSEYQHQHIHRTKASKTPAITTSSSYYGLPQQAYSLVAGRTATLPHSGQLRAYSPAPPIPERAKAHQTLPLPAPPPKPQRMYQQPVTSMAKSVRATPPPQGPPPPAPSPRMGQSGTAVTNPGYQMAPERPPVPERSQSNYINLERRQDYYYSPCTDRRLEHHRSYPTYLTSSSSYEDPYYGDRTYGAGGSRSGSVTPIIDEEARARVEYMERQLASLTGLVHKALTTPRPTNVPREPRDPEMAAGRDMLHVPATRESITYKTGEASETKSAHSSSSSPSLSDDFKPESKTLPRPLSKEEKSVSFSEDPPSMSSPTHGKQHMAQQHSDREQRQLGKPAPPPKPSGLGPSQQDGKVLMSSSSRDLQITPEMYNQLRLLKKKTKDLRSEVRNLRRMTQAQAVNVRETIRDTSMKLKAMLSAVESGDDHIHGERIRVSREEELYRQDVALLEKDLSDLESAVEELRSNVINRRCRVNMSEVESMALILSKASKTVADLKARFPPLQESLKSVMSAEMEAVVREEKFLKDGPERLENALRRCKKLTGTLVTLKRLASVQEQRLPPASPGMDHRASSLPTQSSLPETHLDGVAASHEDPLGKAASFSGEVNRQSSVSQKAETSLDALLDELQTIARPSSSTASPTSSVFSSSDQRRSSDILTNSSGTGAFKRLPSYPSADSPLKGQLVSQGPSGSVAVAVNTSQVNKVQVSDNMGNRQAVSSGPPSAAASPVPSSSSTPTPELFSKVSVGRVESSDGQQPSSAPAAAATTTAPPAVAARKVPPPPPPRTSSKSPLVSPTSPMAPPSRVLPSRASTVPNLHEPPPVPAKPSAEGLRRLSEDLDSQLSQMRREAHQMAAGGSMVRTSAISEENLLLRKEQLSSNSSSSESVNSQEGASSSKLSRADSGGSGSGRGNMFNGSSQSGISPGSIQMTSQHPPLPPARNRQEILEQRHQELLRRQRQLQEQYARLQQLQRGQTLQKFSPPCGHGDLKKTGSESNINILSKAGLSMSTASGSLTHLATVGAHGHTNIHLPPSALRASTTVTSEQPPATSPSNQSKIYETDII